METKLILIDKGGHDLNRLSKILKENGFSATEIKEITDTPDKPSDHSAQVYPELFENAPIGLLRCTVDGKIISANGTMARMLKFHSPGKLIEEVNGTSVSEALCASPKRWREITDSVLASNGWRSFEEQFLCRDGTRITCKLHLGAAAGADDRVEIHGFIEDISERQYAEKSFQLSQFIIDNASIGIFRGDNDGNIIYVNEHGARALGYSREELCSMSYFDIVPDLTPEWWQKHRKKLAATGSNAFESIHRRKNGTVFPVEVTVSYLKFGEELVSCSFAQDITSLKQAEERLKLSAFSMDNIADAVQWITKDARFWNVNRAACEMLGYSREEILSMSIADIDPFFILEDWQRHIEEIRQTGSIYLPNRFHRARDGRILPVEITTNYLVYNGVEYYCAIVRDITERVRAEKEASFFRALIEYTRDPVYVLDPTDDGRMLYVNQAACSHFGLSLEEMRTMRIPDWDPEWDMAKMPRNLQKMKEGHPLRFETVHKIASGKLVPVEVTANYLEHDGRELVLGYFQDIRGRRKAQDEQLRTQKLESLGVLAGGIAHDFNNLLMGIMGNLSLVRLLLPGEGKARERLQRCEKAVKEATNLTYQLLTFSRGGEPVKRAIDLFKVVQDAVAFSLRGSKVAGKLQIAEGLWPIEADEGQIGQVVYNLLINADQSMPAGGVVRVALDNCSLVENEVAALQSGPYVRISVADQGCGIPPENLSRIFDPYFTTKEAGTGLGLTSIYSIVKKHGGEVVLSSKVGEGTQVKVYLPASPEGRVEEKAPETPSVPTTAGYVIVMDDDENIREVAGEMLSYFGYRFTLCTCGEEAVALFKAEQERGVRPDAIIMDLTVPGKMGGLEAASLILDLDPSARIIVSSGYSHDAAMSDFKKHGFSEALHKPFSMEEMRTVLNASVAKGQR
jgi:PAS domain S-box-containing protein